MAAPRSTGGRKPTGQVIERQSENGTTFAIRFRAYGKRRYVTLGSVSEGWNRERVDLELENVLADVRRGIWSEPEDAPVLPTRVPMFSTFARAWLDDVRVESKPTTIDNYEWAVERHLVPYFGGMQLTAITKSDVDTYRRSKISEREATGEGLSNNSINKTIFRLGQILDCAKEMDLIADNVARGKARRAKAEPSRATWLNSADQISALIDSAGKLDRGVAKGKDRALVATLLYAGLRISEALDLRWCDLDLPGGRINIPDAKTEAGIRTVNIIPALRDELVTYAADHRPTGATSIARVFGTSGPKGRDSASNVRRRVLTPAIESGNVELGKRGLPTMGRITPHSLRRTFASILFAVGEDAVYAMGQLGHSDPKFTLRVYAQMMSDRSGERDRIKSLVNGDVWAPMGTNEGNADNGEVGRMPTEPLNVRADAA